MPVDVHGCSGCGRAITAAEAAAGNQCAMCRRASAGTSGPPLAANGEAPNLRPLRPKLSLRSAAVAAPADVVPVATPPTDALVASPVALPVAPVAPAAPPPTAAEKQRPNLRLRNAPSEATAEASTDGNWQVHFGREGFIRRQEVIRGPFTWEEVCCLVRNGTLMPEHRVRREGESTWRIAKTMPGLFDGWNLKARETRDRRIEEEKRLQAQESEGFFAPERRALSWGPLGGILLMVIAAVWFIVGLYNNVLFYYPPVLFVIGLVGFFKSLAE